MAVRALTHMPGAPIQGRNAQGDSPLTWAVWYGHLTIVKELLAAGAASDVNGCTAKGETAAMFAAYRNLPEVRNQPQPLRHVVMTDLLLYLSIDPRKDPTDNHTQPMLHKPR